jgi:protein-disulfide isomerase
MAERKNAKRALALRFVLAALALAIALASLPGCKDSNANGATSSGGGSPQPSAEPKDVVLPGVDTSAMTPRERHEFSSLVTELIAPCPSTPVPVAQCVLEKRACAACGQAAKFIASAVRAGVPDSDIEHAYKERFDPSAIKTLPLAGSPSKGPDGAPVTIVEFADFECPHCRAAVPVMDAVLAAHPDKVRLVYKFVVLSMHVHAEPAARAAWAAGQQGKFWEMEHLLFERQEHLEQADLERYAQMLKLDMDKWKADMESPAAKDRLAQDRKLEDDLKLQGTPTIYVNGRELDVEADESLEDRVDAELGVTPPSVTAPPASASATPTDR